MAAHEARTQSFLINQIFDKTSLFFGTKWTLDVSFRISIYSEMIVFSLYFAHDCSSQKHFTQTHPVAVSGGCFLLKKKEILEEKKILGARYLQGKIDRGKA